MDPLLMPLLILAGLALVLLGIHGLPSRPGVADQPRPEPEEPRIAPAAPPGPALPASHPGDIRRHEALILHLLNRVTELQSQLDELRSKVEGDTAKRSGVARSTRRRPAS